MLFSKFTPEIHPNFLFQNMRRQYQRNTTNGIKEAFDFSLFQRSGFVTQKQTFPFNFKKKKKVNATRFLIPNFPSSLNYYGLANMVN